MGFDLKVNNILFTGINPNELLEQIGQLIEKKLEKALSHSPKPNKAKFLTRKEVAQLLNVTVTTLHEWTKLGWIQSYKVGRRVLYKEVEVISSIDRLALCKHKKGGGFYGA